MKRNQLIVYFTIYIVVLALFAFFWVDNFSNFVRTKGNDFLICVTVVVIITYLYLFLIFFNNYKINIVLIFIIPPIIAVICFFLAFITLVAFNVIDTPRQITFTFISVYASLMLLFMLFNRRSQKISNKPSL
mgnify:CR=1 FL=1